MTRVEISKDLVIINALSSVLTRLVSVGLLVWVNKHLLERLSAEEYAPFPVVASVVVFTQIFMAVLTGAIARYVTEAYAKGDLRRVTEIVSSMMPAIAIGALAYAVLGGLASWKVGSFLTIEADQVAETQLMMGLLMASQAIATLTMPFTVGLYVRQKFVQLNLIQLGQQLLRLALLGVLLFGVSTRVVWVVVATEVSTLLGIVVTVALSRRLIPELRFERRLYRRKTASELISFGAWTMVGNFVWRIRTSSDAIILNKLGTATDVTAFYVGALPDRQMDGVMSVASNTLQPALTAMHATNKQGGLQRAYLRGNRIYLWIALAVAVPLVVFARELVTLYVGQTYIQAAAVVVLVVGVYPLTYASEMLYRIALAPARVRGFFSILIVAGLSKVAISILLVSKFGMGALGAAWSTLIVGAVAQLGFLWPLGLRMLELPFRRYLRETLLPGCFPGAVAAIACYVIKLALPAASWLSVSVDVALGLTAYGLAMRLVLQPEDRADHASILISRLKRRSPSGSSSDCLSDRPKDPSGHCCACWDSTIFPCPITARCRDERSRSRSVHLLVATRNWRPGHVLRADLDWPLRRCQRIVSPGSER